jgi:hypothetical protein
MGEAVTARRHILVEAIDRIGTRHMARTGERIMGVAEARIRHRARHIAIWIVTSELKLCVARKYKIANM